jgi:serine/threonine protein kinase
VFEGPGLSRTPAPSDAARDVCYAAATWIDGVGLREVAPLAPADAFRLATDLASALKALHGKGLIHRDLHPGNVIVDRTGRSVLIDFGSARHDDGSRTVTVSGVVGFIPPDCLHGQGNAASDRWGLGMLVVFALLGHPQGSTGLAQLERELHAALRGIGQPRRAVGLLRRMVDPDPGRRPDEMGRWADELADCLSRPRGRRRRLLAKVGVVGTAGICAGLLAWGSPHETAGTHTPVASVECREAGDGS